MPFQLIPILFKLASTIFAATKENIGLAKKFMQPKCPSMHEWIKMCYVCAMEYYSAIKRENLVIYDSTDFEGIMLSEIS